MSGGYWAYQEWKLRHQANTMKDLFDTLADTEHLMDWALSGDTLTEPAKDKLWDLWKSYFDRTYGE